VTQPETGSIGYTAGMSPSPIAHFGLLVGAFYAACVIIVATVIYQERDPSTTLAWVLVFVALPLLGFVLYVMFGRDLRRSASHDRRRIHAEALGREAIAPMYARAADGARDLVSTSPPIVARLATAIRELNGTEPLPCTNLEILPASLEMFDRLYRDIEAARDHVHLEYYIWEDDELTRRFCELLGDKARSGVEVRILYDWLGSLRYSKKQLGTLRRSGACVRADAARLLRLNYRNHRKIVVIDGHTAYTGGANFGQEYIDGGRRFDSWRDTTIRFGGPLVSELQRLFAVRWMRIAGEDLFSSRCFPDLACDREAGEPVWGHVVYSGAESRIESIRQAFLVAIGSATIRVRVQSPYFVPDQGLMDGLVAQSFAGVDVELMMAGVHDKRLPWWAAFTYIDKLLDAGGAVYQYQAGFFHPKTMTIDGSVAVIGTTNFDNRSFSLHDELSIFFYSGAVTAAQDAVFDADLEACHALTALEVANLGRPTRLRNALARLVSRLL
jgi:cardiolipin synthase